MDTREQRKPFKKVPAEVASFAIILTLAQDSERSNGIDLEERRMMRKLADADSSESLIH